MSANPLWKYGDWNAAPKAKKPEPEKAKRVNKSRKKGWRAKQTAKKRAAKAKGYVKVCAEVDARDGGRCQCCGRMTRPVADLSPDARHHHHIVYRSQGGKDEPENVITLCNECHDREHQHRIKITGTASALVIDGRPVRREAAVPTKALDGEDPKEELPF